MNRNRILEDPLLIAVIGPILYIVIWILILPMVAETSTRLAVLTLTGITGVYCFSIAQLKDRNQAVWAAFGILAGFVELGIVPVLFVSLIRSQKIELDGPQQALTE